MDAYLFLVSNRTNEVMRYLTIMSGLVLPLSFVVASSVKTPVACPESQGGHTRIRSWGWGLLRARPSPATWSPGSVLNRRSKQALPPFVACLPNPNLTHVQVLPLAAFTLTDYSTKPMGPRRFAALFALALLAWSSRAHAIRPFITDDARVVGRGHLQLESWWRRDKESMQVWAFPAFGPTDRLELSMGGVVGTSQKTGKSTFALSMPLVQAKFLVRETTPNGLPGVALSVGGIPPIGRGGFESDGLAYYSYLAVTESLFHEEGVLIHANVGAAGAAFGEGKARVQLTWGVGTQVRLIGDFHGVFELFSGDPYAPSLGGAIQAGFRHIFNDHLQLDATMGSGVFGDTPLPFWVSSGVRIVSHELF